MSQQISSNYAVCIMDTDGEVIVFASCGTFRDAATICDQRRKAGRLGLIPRFDKAWVCGSKYGRDVALY